MKKQLLAATAAFAAFAAVPAQAAQFLTIVGAAGSYGENGLPPALANGSFTQTFTFTTPTGFVTGAFDIGATFLLGAPNVTFTSVVFNNGTSNFNFGPNTGTGGSEARTTGPIGLVAGATNTITVMGTAQAGSTYNGTMRFSSAVPEPGTWALMLLGFGVVGYSMRRRPKVAYVSAI